MKDMKRYSGIELLRIVMIFLIIVHHYSVHGGFGTFSANNLTSNAVIVQLLSMYGRMACSVFVLITGYFTITKEKFNYQKIISLLLDMTLYTTLSFVLLYYFGYRQLTKENLMGAILPLFKGGIWFVVYYIIFSLFIPYLNSILLSMKKEIYLKLLGTIYIIWSILPFFMHYITRGNWDFSNVDFFIVMYITGAYIKLHGDFDKRIQFWSLSYGKLTIITFFAILLSVIIQDYIGLVFHDNYYIKNATFFRLYNNPIAVLFAIYAFLYAKNLRINSPVINQLALSVLGIYLIHDNQFIRSFIWGIIYPNVNYLNSSHLFLHAIVKTVSVFALCLLIDQIRLKIIDKPIKMLIGYFCEKCSNKFSS